MRRLIKIAAVVAGLVAGGVLAATQNNSAPASDNDRRNKAKEKSSLIRIIKIGVLLIALALAGFLVAASGIIPIKASSGHWAITEWFLNFSMERSISTYSLGVEAPSLDKEWLVLKGAGHYEIGCNPCHGNPKMPSPRIAQAMTPSPPYLPSVVHEWDPEELFYIVKHGVKFTGMPAWPAQQRDDEVWAVVAFLRKFSELDAEQYEQLIGGGIAETDEVAPIQGLLEPESALRALAESCDRCHGRGGVGRGWGAFPKLAGQRPNYLDLSLQAYARGDRHSGIMGPIAARLTHDEMRELARYYAGLAGASPERASGQDAAAIERGSEIASRGIPGQRVPACAACHGPGGDPRNTAYPALAGQYAEYLALQLELFKNEKRGGTAYAHIMRRVASGLTPEQMRDVALYFESLASFVDRPAQ
jgi:cytochrome c553